MKYLLFTALLLTSPAHGSDPLASRAELLQRRVNAVGLVAVAQDPDLTARERSWLRLMADLAGDSVALRMLGPEPVSPDASRFKIGPGTRFERRNLP